jgi:hypothetical protein
MNGRVYDPVLGRFLSPDPIVQAPYDTQGLNRYAYVRNNPMRYTDPSGFCGNWHPAADKQAEQCYTEEVANTMLEVVASRFDRWPELLAMAGYGQLLAAMRSAASVVGSDEQPPVDIETINVNARRIWQDSQLPGDVVRMAAYNYRLMSLIDRMMESSAHLGEDAVNYYIAREAETGNGLYRVPGTVAALWTPQTYQLTSGVLGVGSGLGRWSARPFWQYFPAETRGYRSTWLTRGTGWSPPYRTGPDAASMLSLPAYNPGTAVRPVYPAWYEYIRGPRVVDPQPSFGSHAVGGGLEYRILPFDK